MTAPLVRQAHDATNVLHSLIYFAPEAEQHFTAAGLEPGRMSYFAGRAAPMGAHLELWHALSLLREHRGDGHVAALTAAGLSGLEALITHTATGQGFIPEFARASRGWPAADWDAATAALAARGLLDAAGELTAAGQEVRATVERETDRMAAAPWRHLGDEATEQVIRLGRQLSRTVVKAGAFPAAGVFARPRA